MQKSGTRASKIAELKTSLRSLPLFAKNIEKMQMKSSSLEMLEPTSGQNGAKGKEDASENDHTTGRGSEETDPTCYNSIL